MSQTLNVLSIDFDYFQNVSKDVLMNCYPAGLDLSLSLIHIFLVETSKASQKIIVSQ